MSYLSIILLAFALSIDACVVSFSYGLTFTQKRTQNALTLASTTGFFQGLMPVIGYYLTNFVKSYIEPYAKYIVLFIFLYLGIKFIKEAYEAKDGQVVNIDLKCLLLLGIATSIDAFSAGISLSLFGNRIMKPALLIAFITFLNSHLGFAMGGKLKNIPTKFLEIFAGLILVFLGIKAII